MVDYEDKDYTDHKLAELLEEREIERVWEDINNYYIIPVTSAYYDDTLYICDKKTQALKFYPSVLFMIKTEDSTTPIDPKILKEIELV